MENKGNSIGLDISLNTLSFNDLLKNKSNLINNSLVISSYESLYNDEYVTYSYQNNFISLIDNYNNIIPLTYNLKYENGIFKNIDSHIIGVDIDNYTIKDSSILPREKTIELTYIYGWDKDNIPINIIDSYSYMIDSYSYSTIHNNFSYECEYNYYLYTYYTYEQLTELGYVHESYTYYPISYNLNNNDVILSYNIRYSYDNYIYSYNYSYTYLINQFENDFIFVDQEYLNKADNNIGIYKSDSDTTQIVNDLLSINKKYTDLLYKHNIDYYNKIYQELNIKYNDLLLKSSIINSYIFNYKPIEDIILNFSENNDIIYFDKNKKKKINNNNCIKIDNNIDEFNLCIPFEYCYKSYTEKLNPFNINKVLINILQKDNNKPVVNDYITVNNLFNYNRLFNDEFQGMGVGGILNIVNNIEYNSLNNIYKLISKNEIQLNIDKSYLYENKINKYDVESNLYYGELKYIFNFKLNKQNILKNNINKNFYQFDILIFIKDIVLGNCNHINENYKLSFSFYIDFEDIKYTQTYDVLYHDYNYGFNFDKHGKRIGLCFLSEGCIENNPKPIFVKYDQYYQELSSNTINVFNDLNNLNNLPDINLSDLDGRTLQVVLNNEDNMPYTVEFNEDNLINITPTSIIEKYYEDKIYGVKFNYLKKEISLITNQNNTNTLLLNLIIDTDTHKIKISDNFQTGINKIFKFDNNNISYNIFKQNILKKYFPSIYNIRSSGTRNGDYYIPSINDYYIMDLYNILSLYEFKDKCLMSNIFKDKKPVIANINDNNKINCLYYNNTDISYDNIFVIPFFKIPDYSIINNGKYNIIFDKDLNCETVIINTNYIGYISLKVKKYYNYSVNTNSSNIWYINCNSNNVSNNINVEIENHEDYIDLNIIYQYHTNNKDKIIYFDIYYIDSDPLLNTSIIYREGNNINCRILCKVFMKINT